MAAVNLLAASTVKGEQVTREDILWAIDVVSRTADEINDGDITPSSDEVVKTIKQVFGVLNNRPSTKTAIVNAIMLKGNIKHNEAEYMVAAAQSLGVIVPQKSGTGLITPSLSPVPPPPIKIITMLLLFLRGWRVTRPAGDARDAHTRTHVMVLQTIDPIANSISLV